MLMVKTVIAGGKGSTMQAYQQNVISQSRQKQQQWQGSIAVAQTTVTTVTVATATATAVACLLAHKLDCFEGSLV